MILTGDSLPRKPSEPATIEESKDIIDKLIVEFNKVKAIGLAAPQIGILKRVFIIRLLNKTIKGFVNPRILNLYDSRVVVETCMSFPGESVSTGRYNSILAEDDLNGRYGMSEIEAVCYQHECDHLDGLTMYDRKYKKVDVGRNDPCPCGSGKKYKKCCGM